VYGILPEEAGGYTVVFRDPRTKSSPFEKIKAKYVLVSAGSLGSTKLLLRMKHSGQLPNLSAKLGRDWCGNGDLLGMALNCAQPMYPSTGPTITAAVHFFNSSYPDGFPHGLYVEDAAIPNLLAWYLTAMTPSALSVWEGIKGAAEYARGFFSRREPNMANDVGPLLFRDSVFVSRTLAYLGMGRDRSTGHITLRRKNGKPLSWEEDCGIQLDWNSEPSELHFERLVEAMQRLTAELGGDFVENPLSFLTRYIAVHPLGGCPMGDSPSTGVVNALTGEAFGYPGLYVADGSILPTSVGPNPSLTIAAVAELFAERFLAR
jgi:cholesterol oxidase